MKPHWTYPETATLRRLAPNYAAVAAAVGRSVVAVQRRALRLGLRARAVRGSHDATVKRLARKGWFDWEIALELGRDRTTVSHIRRRLGVKAARHRGRGA